MTGRLLTSKYRRPSPRPGTVRRPRLAERFTPVALPAVTVVSAPAGFGKTTALIEWLAADTSAEPAVAWLSLERGDSDPGVFWTYVVTAIQSAVPSVGQVALELLAGSPSSVDDALAALVNDLDAMPSDLVLVLDDYHLIEGSAVHGGVAFLLEHQPARVHVVLATRLGPTAAAGSAAGRGTAGRGAGRRPALPSRRSRRLLQRVDAAAAECRPTSLRSRERTEGWIAALQLAALSLQGRTDASAFIAGFAGDDRYIVDYLAEEVLSSPARGHPGLPARDVRTRATQRIALRRRHRARRRQGRR